MKNRKIKIVQISLFFMIIVLQIGCNYDNPGPEYCQFTPDVLSHLYFDKDSLVYDGIEFHYSDTIAFLHNSDDTLLVKVNTRIYDLPLTFGGAAIAVYGESRMDFIAQTGFRFARVRISKEHKYDDAVITLDFYMLIGGCSGVILNQTIDTAKVLDKTYNNVYKIEYPDNSPSKLRCIYFAKKDGLIKVETADGRKLEKLEISKEDIKTILSD
jgi:hypothetical protein